MFIRKHLAVILSIMAIALLVGAGTVRSSIPTPNNETLTLEQTEPVEPPIEPIEPFEPFKLYDSGSFIVWQNDGYLQIKSELVGEDYLVQIKSPDGTIDYGYSPYSTDIQTVPLPDTDKVKLTLYEVVSPDLCKSLLNLEFGVDIKDENKRYTIPNVFVYYDDSFVAAQLAKYLRYLSNSDLAFIVRVFGMVADLPYDYEKAYNSDSLPFVYIPNVDEVLMSGTGICSDKSALLAAMLRSQGIPTKYVSGEVNGNPHAWNEVYIDNTWFPIDSTFGTFYVTSDYTVKSYK